MKEEKTQERASPDNEKGQHDRWLISLLGIITLVFLIAPFVILFWKGQPDSVGEWGDLFGGFYGAIGFFWMVYGLAMQRDELSMQRQELQAQREQLEIANKESAAQRSVMEAQAECMRQQAESLRTQASIMKTDAWKKSMSKVLPTKS